MDNNIKKILVVSSAASTAEYTKDFFQRKRDEGFYILSFSSSVNHFANIGFIPDGWTFLDPHSVYKYKETLNKIGPHMDLITIDQYRNSTDFRKNGLTTSVPINQDFSDYLLNSFKRLIAKPNPIIVQMSDMIQRNKYITNNVWKDDLFLYIGSKNRYRNFNNDKLSCFILPMLMNYFQNLKEVICLNFWDFPAGSMGSSGVPSVDMNQYIKSAATMRQELENNRELSGIDLYFKDKSEISVIVQARTSSQRCPRKMVRPFAGSTLIDICLDKLVNSSIPNENIWVAVNEQELIDIASKYPVNIFQRSETSAASEGQSVKEIFEWWDKIHGKYVVMVNACLPLLSTNTIESFIKKYAIIPNNGMYAVFEKRNYFWNQNNEIITRLTGKTMNTKTASVIKEAAHCLYASKLSDIGKDIWMGNFNKKDDIRLYTVPESEIFDIDYEWQFDVAESLFEKQKSRLTT